MMGVLNDILMTWAQKQQMIGRYAEHVDWLVARYGTPPFGPDGILYLCAEMLDQIVKEHRREEPAGSGASGGPMG